MCISTPKPPPPPAAPSRPDADTDAERVRRLIAKRRGSAASVKSGPSGAPDFGRNTQFTGLSSGTQTTLGVGP